MAKTVIQSFEDFRTKLEITSTQTGNVSTRHTNLRNNLPTHIKKLDDFLTGSYMRSTMIAPLKDADVDVFYVLPAELWEAAPNGPANVLAKVKRAIGKCYTEATESSRNGQAITIKFSDFKMDVVPAFTRQGGGYQIPDPIAKKWIGTDPKKHVTLWAESNKYHDGKLVPFIKMIKAWNRAHSGRFRSFHLETMVREMFQYRKITAYADAALHFFENGYTGMYVNDPAGYGGGLYGYLPTATADLMVYSLAFNSARDKAKEAIAFNKAGDNEKAIGKWGVIFGSYFPSYG